MSISPIIPKFISIGMPIRSEVSPDVSPIDLLRPGSVKLEKMMESSCISYGAETSQPEMEISVADDPIPIEQFQPKPSRNEWSGIDTKKAYEESVRCMKDVIYAATKEEALSKFTELEGKLIPPYFTIALSYLKTRRLI